MTTSTTSALAGTVSYAEAVSRYATVQGNVLKGHGRDYANLLFVRFPDADKGREWLQSLLPGGGAPVEITDTKRQLAESQRFKQFGIKGSPFATVLLTATGLELLGDHKVADTEKSFAQGMRTDATRQRLNDSKLEEWDAGWRQPDGSGPSTIHALLLLADDDQGLLDTLTRQTADALEGQGVQLVLAERGNVLRNDNQDGIEHFGYADGVSQPVYLTEDMPTQGPEGAKDNPLAEDVDRWNPAAPPEQLVLVKDPLAPESFGSFFVFRKLEQDVKGFKAAEEHLAEELKLPEPDAERTGAMIIGRFEDGTPVAVRYIDGLNKPIINNFNYSGDLNGLKCPFHAHIRKVNPRTTPVFDPATERQRQLTRRGIPYGKREEASSDRAKVGLLFMCYQRSIADQFEFVQGTWANKDTPSTSRGVDVVIGQVAGKRPAQHYPAVWGEQDNQKDHSFAAFVTLRGGEYFYAPSMPGLQTLATGPGRTTA